MLIFKYLSQIHSYSTASTENVVLIIGGNYESTVVAQFENKEWSQLDNLMQGRHYHGSITIKGKTMVIGGQTKAE